MRTKYPAAVVLVFSIFLILFFSLYIQKNITGINKQKTLPDTSLPPPVSSQVEQTPSQKSLQTTLSGLARVKVIRVIDGDTIEIEGGNKVRYIGIDTPETSHPQKGLECFGKEATNKNKELLEGKEVMIEKDVSETDKYGRLLRYVYTGDIFVNDYLVREGFAYSSSYPPDVKYQNQLLDAQKEARQENRGLWNSCQQTTSNQTQQLNPQSAEQYGCRIKGNISSSGEKIYHMQNQKYYDKTQIDEAKGERWFCTEEDARSAGWRKSKI